MPGPDRVGRGTAAMTSFSVQDILRAAEALPEAELRELVDGVVAIRARREAPALSGEESELLGRINRGLPDDLVRRLAALRPKRDAEALTADELDELRRLGDRVEQFEAERLEALDRLAALRGVSLSALLKGLGITGAP